MHSPFRRFHFHEPSGFAFLSQAYATCWHPGHWGMLELAEYPMPSMPLEIHKTPEGLHYFPALGPLKQENFDKKLGS